MRIPIFYIINYSIDLFCRNFALRPAVKNLVHAPGISPDSEFLPKSKAGRWFARLGRSSPNALKEWGSQMTRNFLLKIANFDQSRYVEDRLEVFLSHTPAGTSLRNLVHYAQVIDKREDFISKFDHGNRRNLIVSIFKFYK